MTTVTQQFASYFHTPDGFAKAAFIHVLRAGHLQAAQNYVVERKACTGHDLIYCVKGKGYARVRGVEHSVGPSQFLWIDGRHPHKHWTETSEPWEVLWVRADGCALTLSAEALGVTLRPVFTVNIGFASLFKDVMKHLKARPIAIDALLHADLSSILAGAFASRFDSCDRQEALGVSPGLKLAMAKMGAYSQKRWTVGELAQIAQMSEQRFFRMFHEATGASPIAWLRRQRLNQAKRKLVETTDSIKEIADQVGYSDAFYFSRDFRVACGLSPKRYREQEKFLHASGAE